MKHLNPQPLRSRPVRTVAFAALGALGLMLLGLGLRSTLSSAQDMRAAPVPTVDEPAGRSKPEVAVFAGGCFWGIQGVFQHVHGVLNAVSGFTGGSQANAHYELVSTGTTGHAESVQITYDPRQISYARLLQIFFSIHDPTEVDRQGPDDGTQYRSAVFPLDAEQASIAQSYLRELGASHTYPSAVVTSIEPGKTFFPAEDYHQNFLVEHPNFPYIAINDQPKIAALHRLFPQIYRPQPVLVLVANDQFSPSH